MNLSDVLAALRALTPAERVRVRVELFTMINDDNRRAFSERPCEHPKHRLREERIGDRSINIVCGRCGEVVEYR